MTTREANRALLARQGLLERLEPQLSDVTESIGALQAQYWPAIPAAFYARVCGFAPDSLYRALAEGELLMGTLIRGTIHVVSADEYPSYAAVADAFNGDEWRRTGDTSAPPSPLQQAMRTEMLAYTTVPRTADEIVDFLEAWIAKNPGAVDQAEADYQRTYKWRPIRSCSALTRVPAEGRWGLRSPSNYQTAPAVAAGTAPVDLEDAIATVILCHLRAFGPAAAEDIAQWIKWRVPAVRRELSRLEPQLERCEGEDGRVLYDIPGQPRPAADVPAPVRLLPWFDSILLSSAPARRGRILPDAYRDAVYSRINLQVRATFLVDGMVAGTWSVEKKGRKATLALRPLQPLTRAHREELLAEAHGMVRICQPSAATHDITIDE